MRIEIQETKFEKTVKIFTLVSISLILAGFTFLFLKVNEISRKIALLNTGEGTVKLDGGQTLALGCGQDCKDQIRQAVSDAIATISSVPKPSPISSSPTFTAPVYKTVYIPLGGSGSTQSTDWATVDGTGVYIDAKNEYGSNVKITWEAFLSVAYSNGQTFARLWDDTNEIAVNGSEISITAKATPTLVTSGNLDFWAGRNLYKVQIKSLNSFTANYTGGRIKINF